MTSLTAEYDFESFTAMLILADYDFEDFYVTDWSRIDTDDLYPDPLYYYGDAGRDTKELRLSSTNDGPFQWFHWLILKLNTILLLTALLNGKYQMQMG